jgi:hypothetical protein
MGVGEESVWATEVARTKFFENDEDGIKAIRERADATKFRGRSKNLIVPGKSGAAGPIGLELHYEGHEVLIKHLMGADVVTTDEDAPNNVKRHVFKLSDSPRIGLSLEAYRGAADAVLYTGVRPNAGTFTIEQDAIARLSLDLMAKQEDNTEAASTPTFPSHNPILWSHVTALWGGAAKEIQRFECTVTQNLDGDRRKLGDREVLAMEPAERREVTGQIEMFFESDGEYDDFLAETERILKITAEGAAITPSASKYTMIWEFKRALFTGETPAPDGPGGFSIILPFEAYGEAIPSPTFNPLEVTMINQTASV